MDPKEKQKLYILFGIIGAAVLVVYYNLLLRPLFTAFIANNREFYAIKRSVKSARALIANEERIRKQYENFKSRSEELENRLFSQDEISSLLQDFSGIADFSGVKILKIKPLELLDDVYENETGQGLYSKLPILIEARAGYHQLGVFINRIESMEKVIRIDGLDIRGNPREPRHHEISLRLVTYVIR